MSAELIADSVQKMNFIGRLIGERIVRIANSKLTRGPGIYDFESSVTNCATCVTATKATAVTVDEIIYLVQSVNPAYRIGNDVFMTNNSIL